MQLFMAKRNRLRDVMVTRAPEVNPHAFVRELLSSRRSEANFMYVGAGSLTVRGPVTGRAYYFAEAGVALSVDGRDAPGLDCVAGLQRLFSA